MDAHGIGRQELGMGLLWPAAGRRGAEGAQGHGQRQTATPTWPTHAAQGSDSTPTWPVAGTG